MRIRILLALGFLSASIIAFQLALMQILSIVQWYHFAYMVISVALLGFGAAGTLLSIYKNWFVHRFETTLFILMAGCCLTMSTVIRITQIPFFQFDSYLLFADSTHIFLLLLTYLLIFLPFIFGALAIGLIFIKYVDQIGKLYFANMVGSGLGAIGALLLMWIFAPSELPAIIAVFGFIAAIVIMPNPKSIMNFGILFLAVVVILGNVFYPPDLAPSQFKGISKTLNLPNARIELEKNSPFGQLQIVSSPALRYAPGLSLNYQNEIPNNLVMFNNGNWYGAILPGPLTDSTAWMNYSTNQLPFAIKLRKKVLILFSGTGMYIAHSLKNGAEKIVAVEPNPTVLSIFRNELAEKNDSLFYHQSVELHNVSPRSFLHRDQSEYDLIILPTIGAFGGTSGLFSVQEQYLLTKEAFWQLWQKLSPGGAISISCYLDYPVRNPLKILSTIVEVLEDLGVENLDKHIVAIRSWSTISFVISQSELTMSQTNTIREFCYEMSFDPVLLPDIKNEERDKFNALQDNQFFHYVDEVLSPERNHFYEAYDFNIKPATDHRPYFSQFIQLKSLRRIAEYFGAQAMPFFELGYLIVWVTFVQIFILAVLLIILPLFKIKFRRRGRIPILLYFSGIGLGYIFVEIVLIQRFLLYFGNAVYSAAIVISAMLIFSGIGSYVSSKIIRMRKSILSVAGFVVAFLIIYSTILTPILLGTISITFSARLFLGFLIIAPVAFLMGFLFPLGLRTIARIDSSAVPWAWGINGSVSVVSTVLATMIAIEMGFTWVMILAAGAYCLPIFATMNRGIIAGD